MFAGGVFDSGGVPHRYWRIQAASASQNSNWESFFQISFFNSMDGSGTDLCIGKTATASTTYSGFPASYANDNNTGTRWANNNTETPPSWWSCDLTTPQEVHSVKLMAFYSNPIAYFAINWNLQWSDDNTNWTTANSIALSNTTALQTFTNL